MYCDSDNCSRRSEETDYIRHYFPLYGGYLSFHAECCPGHADGSICDDEHPEGTAGYAFVTANNQEDMDAGIYVRTPNPEPRTAVDRDDRTDPS